MHCVYSVFVHYPYPAKVTIAKYVDMLCKLLVNLTVEAVSVLVVLCV